MKKKSVKRNAALNVLKTAMNIIFPLITFPYVTRVLHAEYLGKIGYSQSIISYFALIAALGISTYAIREGAKLREVPEQLKKFVDEVFTINIITTCAAYILLVFLLALSTKLRPYKMEIIILATTIIFTTIGVDWINAIFEDYLFITVRSIINQFISLILLLLFVKRKSDYYCYVLLLVVPQMVICICNFFYCRKYCKINLTVKCHFLHHIKPMLTLFANNMAITIYCSVDSTMLGWMVSDYYVGIYAVAVKVYSTIRSLIASIFIVCIPRLSYYFCKSEEESAKDFLNSILCILILLVFPAVAGLMLMSKPVILILAGKGYEEAVFTLQILSIALVFAIIGGVFTNCINIPAKMEMVNLKATTIAAAANIVLNIFMIPAYQQNGAAVTTVIAEIIVIVSCFIFNKKIIQYFNWKNVLINTMQSLFGSISIVISYAISVRIAHNNILICAYTMVLSTVLYSTILLLIKNRFAVELAAKIKNKIVLSKKM